MNTGSARFRGLTASIAAASALGAFSAFADWIWKRYLTAFPC